MHRLRAFLAGIILLGLIVSIGLLVSNGSSITGAAVMKTVSCYQDSDCDDHIAETEDLCKNPGMEYSICISRSLK